MSDLIGQTLDHYRFDGLLAHGGMGLIYQATDLELQRPVAIKVMHQHLANHQQFRDRFAQEARAASSLENHPNIVRILDFSPAHLYIVMELVTGGSLRDYINHMQPGAKYLDYGEAVHLVCQIADALDCAHSHNMIHRDVKPENILLKPAAGEFNHLSYQAMLTDFGLAKLTETIGITLTGRPLGTFPYMSPEQFKARGVDGRTDIYALGIVLYEITTGQLPFRPQNLMEAFRMHTNDAPAPPGIIRPNYPAALESIVLKCLEKSRRNRYQTAAELVTVLRNLGAALDTGYVTEPQPEDHKTIVTAPPVALTQPQFDINHPTPTDHDSIIIYQQGQNPRVVPISKSVIEIGRDPGNDIVLEDRQVSRDHAQIERNADGSYWIKDLSSTNRSLLGDTLLEANLPHEWMFGQTLQISAFALRLQPAALPPVDQIPQSAPHLSNVVEYATQYNFTEPANGEEASYRLTGFNVQTLRQPIIVVLTPANLKIKPGESAKVHIELSNQGLKPDEITLDVRGVPGSWAQLEQPVVSLAQGQSIITAIEFTPPFEWTSRAGRHTYTLRVHSTAQQMEVAKMTGVLHIEPFQNITVSLRPKRLQEYGTTTVTIANDGNTTASLDVHVRNPGRGLNFDLERANVSVEPGETETLRLQVRPNPGALVHGATLFHYEVRVRNGDGETHAAAGELLAVANLAGQQPIAGLVPIEATLAPVPESGTIPIPVQVPSLVVPERERGGCLTLWLSAYTGGGLLIATLILIESIAGGFLLSFGGDNTAIYVLSLVLSWSFALVYSVGLFGAWSWRMWAVYLLMFLSFFLIPVGPFLTLIWWLLVRNKRSMFG